MPYSALTFTISGAVNLSATQTPAGSTGNASGIFSNQSMSQNPGAFAQLSNGNGSGNASKLVAGVRTLAPGANETIALANGSLTDVLNNSCITFTTVRGLYFSTSSNANGATAATSMTIGGGNAAFVGWFGNAAGNWTIESGGPPLMAWSSAGRAVTANTADRILVVNNDSGNTLSYIWAIAGQ